MVIAERLVAGYRVLKAGLPADVLLLMQVGAFMHVLDDDARAAFDLAVHLENLAG